MPIHAVCPECRSAYDLSEEQSGKKVRCKKCATVFVVGAAAKPALEDAVRDAEPVRERAVPKNVVPVAPRRASPRDDDFDDRDERRRPAPRKKSGSLGPVLLIGGLAVLGFVVIVGGAALIFGIHWLAKDDASTGDPKIVGGWNPRAQDNLQDNSRANKPVDNTPDDMTPVRFPEVRDDPEDANLKVGPAVNGQLAAGVLRKVKRATARISVTLAEGQASGTGFFGVEENVLLTNAHVLGMLNPDADRPKSIEVILDSGEKSERKFGAQILAVDRDSDLAVLRVIFKPDQTSGTIPKPLEVRPAKDLVETQELYVFGFPLGAQLGKEITVNKTSVASFRKDAHGELDKVQVHGGMNPGNSGGPVVDSDGHVVGVAVSVIRGTAINFAIPGERVRDLLQGRIKEKELDQPFYKDGNPIMPVTIHMIDPLKKIKEVSLDVWTGDVGNALSPSSGEMPKSRPGDSTRMSAPLKYQLEPGKRKGETIGKATGEIVLPELPPGKVYYVQLSWKNGAGTWQWDIGHVHDVQPVERKAARLVLQQQKGERTVTLETERALSAHGGGAKGDDVFTATVNTQIREKTADLDKNTGATMKVQYFNVSLGETREGQGPPPEEAARLKSVAANLGKVTGNLIQDRQGNLQDSPPDLQGVAGESRAQVATLNAQIEQMLKALAVPLPNKDVQYGESWTAQRLITISTHEGIRPQFGSFAMKYTLLGTRKSHAGREEAVIGLAGTVSTGADENQGTKASGLAVLDLATGQISSANLTASLDTKVMIDVRTTGTLTGTLRMRLKRSVQ
jgi:predicted Zn finger-like uncharacterized protein